MSNLFTSYKVIKNIISLYVVGSFSKHELVKGWSDIDVVLIIKRNFTFSELIKLRNISNSIEKKIGYPIHLQYYDAHDLKKISACVCHALLIDGLLMFGKDYSKFFMKVLKNSDWKVIGHKDIERYYDGYIKNSMRISELNPDFKKCYQPKKLDADVTLMGMTIDTVYDMIRSYLRFNRILFITKRSEFERVFLDKDYIHRLNQYREKWDAKTYDLKFISESFKFMTMIKERKKLLNEKILSEIKYEKNNTCHREDWRR